MTKADFKKTLDSYQAQPGEFRILTVPPIQYLMIDGHGDPNTSHEFAQAVQALYPVAYKLKFASKQILGKDYTVMPLEGLWWAKDMTAFTTARDKSQWDFTLMIMQPDWISPAMVADAKVAVAAKVPAAQLARVRFETLAEGLCVQTLHIGSFDAESAVLQGLHDRFVPDNHLRMTQKHHEIYLSDFRKVTPDRLRTILRQPVERV